MEIIISGETVVVGQRKGSSGIRYTWFCSLIGVGGEQSFRTEELAIADATTVLGGSECRHGTPTTQFCPTCHHTEI